MDIRGIGATCVAALVVCVPLMASGAGVGSVPAETPPSNFTVKQYVDSKGCAFIRVGFSGPARWVPRVTRQRRQVCGLAPSLSSNERTQVAASQAPASVTSVEITFDDPVVTSTPRAAAPKPRAQEGASLGTALASLFRPKRPGATCVARRTRTHAHHGYRSYSRSADNQSHSPKWRRIKDTSRL